MNYNERIFYEIKKQHFNLCNNSNCGFCFGPDGTFSRDTDTNADVAKPAGRTITYPPAGGKVREYTIYIPSGLHKNLKVYAAKEDTSISAVIINLLVNFFKGKI